MLALGETAVLGAFCAQDLALFVLFFDLMLVPFYFLIGIWGGAGPRAGDDDVRDLHAGREPADAGRGGRHRHPRDARRRPDDVRALRRCAQRPLSEGTQEWIFLLLRARLPGEDAGLPAARLDARRLHAPRRRRWSRCSRACCRRSAPTASCASCCRCSPTPRVQYQELLLVIALASILYGSVMAFTQTSATLVVGYSSIAQLGFITLGIFSLRRRGRPGRGAPDGQPRARRRAAVLHHRAARRARGRHRRPAQDGRARVPRAGAGGAVPDRRAGDARDAGLRELRRRVPDPDRRLQGEDRVRDRRGRRRRAGRRLHDPAVPALDAQPARAGRRVARDERRATAPCSCRSSR